MITFMSLNSCFIETLRAGSFCYGGVAMIPILSFLCCHRSCFHWSCTAADQCTDGALQFPTGVCGVLQYPAHRYHSFWFFNKNVSAVGAKVCFTFHIVAYVIAKFLFGDLNFLYIHSVLFFLDILVMWGSTKFAPLAGGYAFTPNANKVDLTP